MVEFVSHMAQHIPVDGIKEEFQCLRTICTCDQAPPASVNTCVAKVRGATASKNFWLLPSFEGLQLGKMILEHATKVAAERALSHKYLEQMEEADAKCITLEKEGKSDSLYSEANISVIQEMVSLLEEAEPKIKQQSEKDPSGHSLHVV